MLAGATCAISVPVGTVLAWLLWRTDLPARRVGIVLLAIMLFVPLYLQAAAWRAGFGLQGWIVLNTGCPAWLDEGWPGAIWIHSMVAIPWVVLIAGVGMRLVEPELEEQALLDGSAGQVFWHVTLPRALPTIGVATLWVAILTAGEMTISDLFRIRTYAEEVYTRVAVGPQVGEGPLAVTPGVVLTAGLVLAALVLCGKLMLGGRPLTLRRRWVFRLGRWRWPLAIPAGLALVAIIGVPVGSLCYKAGVAVTTDDAGWPMRSWSAWKSLAVTGTSPWYDRRELGWSLLLGTLASTAAVALAVPLAWLARMKQGNAGFRFSRRSLGTLAVLALVALCLAVPGPVVGVLMIRLLNRPELPPLVWLYDQSIFAPWLALLIRCLPPAVLVMWYASQTIPVEILDAAAIDGAGPMQRLFRIALPNRLAALALAWVIATAVALGDLAASILVVPPGVETLSILIHRRLHSGVEHEVAGTCLAQFAIFAIVAAAALWLANRWSRRMNAG